MPAKNEKRCSHNTLHYWKRSDCLHQESKINYLNLLSKPELNPNGSSNAKNFRAATASFGRRSTYALSSLEPMLPTFVSRSFYLIVSKDGAVTHIPADFRDFDGINYVLKFASGCNPAPALSDGFGEQTVGPDGSIAWFSNNPVPLLPECWFARRR